MKKIYLLATMGLFSCAAVFAQIKNAETKTFKVKAKCVSSKEIIKSAGNQKRISTVSYNANEGIVTIKFDNTKTTAEAILKKIALAGFDNDQYFAPNNVYEKLAADCKYTRDKKASDHSVHSNSTHNHSKIQSQPQTLHADHEVHVDDKSNLVLNAYFDMKDAFVQADQSEILKQAMLFKKILDNTLKETPSSQNLTSLTNLIHKIIQEKDIIRQRKFFADLTQPMYRLAKNAKLKSTVYYQNCPMFEGGSNWLSKDSAIKNPFYGNQMLSCGSTVETLK